MVVLLMRQCRRHCLDPAEADGAGGRQEVTLPESAASQGLDDRPYGRLSMRGNTRLSSLSSAIFWRLWCCPSIFSSKNDAGGRRSGEAAET